ncbi:MAG TPA: hypothetical protein VML92_00495 [Steroidobacteraceae bacterium]|nr:hypothetical protein [Steroidobacteraceae bacterium]
MLAIVMTIPSGVAFSDARPSPVSTDLESFVAQPGVVLDLDEDVGSLRSTDASVAVAAVIASDTGRPGERMRGLRFVMENNTGSDQAWLDETQLAALLDDLSGIEKGIPELQSASSPYRVRGTGACWMPARPMRIHGPSYPLSLQRSSGGQSPA